MPELAETLVLPNELPILELDELWSFVLKKANKRWIWIAPLSANPTSGSFRHRGSFRSNLSKVVDENPACLSSRALFYGFLESVSIGDSARPS